MSHASALPPSVPVPTAWPLWQRRAATVALVWHLAAIALAPLAVPPTSLLIQTSWSGVRPYLEAAHLNHGFHFFAPEPGPSHLIKYELEFADGRTETGVFPDRRRHQPRLLYHRHFMLTEHFNSIAEGGDRAVVQTLARSYADHLLAEHGAQAVTLELVRHLIPQPGDVAEGMRLDDPRLYHARPLGVFTARADR